MSRIGLLVATAGALVAFTASTVIAAPAGAVNPTRPPTVSAVQWTDAHAAAGTASNQLNNISCTSASFCVAVGQQNVGTGGGTLAEVWNGKTWSVVPSADPSASTGDALVSVSCVGPSFCLAVGGSDSAPIAETWNGTAWTLATAATPTGVTSSTLTSVSCVATNVCEVLGTSVTAGTGSIFGNQWNGTALSLKTAASPPSSATTPIPVASGMSCVSSTWCLAVGVNDVQVTATAAAFSEVWNGTNWTLATVPAPGTATGTFLHSVSCAGVTFCTAVGQGTFAGPLNQNLIETWSGTSWAVTPSPDTSATLSQELTGVSCFSATTCSAVGQANAASGPSPATLALAWNGTAWSIVPNTPNNGTTQTQTTGVSCITNWACMASGWAAISGSNVPFAMSAPIARTGYRFVASDGGVFSYGAGAPFLGSMGGTPLNKPIVGMAVMPGGDGYDLVASDGGIFNYGSAQFYGSTGSIHLNQPMVGMALTADGAGYWLVASDGGIFAYGDAQFYGSTGSIKLNKPIVGMAATPDGKGYWLVASDGGIFNYGDAQFSGSAGSIALNKPVVGMAAPVTGGYYLVATDGGIFSYPTTGGPTFFGSTGSIALNKPIVGMTAVSNGYYLSGSDGGVFTYPTTNGPTFYGSTGSIALNAPIVGISG
ncbi:MAG TPA: hypothetical protein VIJ56_04355 [Acidimicrobiales bacterium]